MKQPGGELTLGPAVVSHRGESMNEALRLEIVQRHQQGMSSRAIARELGIFARDRQARPGPVREQRTAQRRWTRAAVGAPSLIDAYEPF